MSTPIERAKVVLEDGTELDRWDDYSINSDLLTPTDGWSLNFGSVKVWKAVHSLVKPDRKVQIWIDGMRQLTGFIDTMGVTSSADSGIRINIQGRDILRPIVKAHIRPNFVIKGLTLQQLVEKVLTEYYVDPPTLFADNAANRQVIGVKGSFNPKDRSGKLQKQIDYCQAHPNEGAFEFISRNLRRFGLWLWTTGDGNLVISGPTYDQEPAYRITRRYGERVVMYPTANYREDRTNVPGYVQVRGKSTAKEWEKTTVVASVTDADAYSEHVKAEPFYIQHDQAETKEQAEAFARQELTRVRQDAIVYECTAVGHRDRETENMFQVDTIAAVDDEICDVRGNFYVVSRTFKKSIAGGTTTDLKMVPIGAIQFSEVDVP